VALLSSAAATSASYFGRRGRAPLPSFSARSFPCSASASAFLQRLQYVGAREEAQLRPALPPVMEPPAWIIDVERHDAQTFQDF
jgi:hypothetical protein